MAFPINYNQKLTFIVPADSTLLVRGMLSDIESQLYKAGMDHIQKSKDQIKFSGPIFRFVWNGFNRFNAVSNGWIKIESISGEIHISSSIYFVETFYWALIFSIIPLSKLPDYTSALIILGLIWGFVFLFNYVLTVVRFNRYLKRILNKLVKEYK